MMTANQHRLPLVEAILDYQGIKRIHMPGHKGGEGIAPPFLALVGRGVFQADVVGVDGLDDFHAPCGCIAEAQQLAAEAWGSDQTLFLVNGTSCGLQALILSLCGPGDKLIIPRNVHRSVVGGMILSGAHPVYMEPEIHETFGLPLGVSPQTVAQALAEHPEAKGVLVVSPTYYGIVGDIRTIADLTHSRGLPLLVDEAHGAHLGFHPGLPPTSLRQGADAVAQGVHKTAGSLSQGALLHLKGNRLPADRIKQYLRLLQTTSPSYLILASLDAARFLLVHEGAQRLTGVLQLSQQIRSAVHAMEAAGMGLRSLQLDFPRVPFTSDPTRIVLNLSGIKLSGYEMERLLRKQYNIQIELSDFRNIVLLLSLGDTPETVDSFITALKQIMNGINTHKGDNYHANSPSGQLPPTPPMVLIPAVAYGKPTRRVLLSEAVNMICGEMVAAYPPGIPVVYPGEQLTPSIITYLSRAKAAGVHLQGMADSESKLINIIE